MLRLTTQNLGDVTVFRLAGRITAGDSDGLRNAVRNQRDARVLVLDLADVHFVAVYQLVEFVRQRVDVLFDGPAERGHLHALAVYGGNVRAERLDVNVDARPGASPKAG